jgi:hypothetical protein
MKVALEACLGGGAKKSTSSERRAVNQVQRRSVELQTNQKMRNDVLQRYVFAWKDLFYGLNFILMFFSFLFFKKKKSKCECAT